MITNKNALRIDLEFASLIPPLTPDELTQLEKNILADGCRDALIIWEDKNIILDGHNRYRICNQHEIKFKTTALDMANREAAADWIDANQLGRRNLTPEAASLLRGRRYNRTKKTAHDGGKGKSRSGDQNDTHLPSTAASIADQHGVSEPTIKRDGQFAAAVEKLKPTVPDIEKRVMTGNVPSRKAVVIAAKEPSRARSILDTSAHVSRNTGESEWYTPPDIIADVRAVMGGIDVDPASCKKANETVKAKIFYDADSNGLEQKWKGKIFLNPPYAQPLVSQFSEALLSRLKSKEIKQACVLVNNATETNWFQAMLAEADAVCFIKGRVKFIDQWGNPGAPLQGQAVLYMGPNMDKFSELFSKKGIVLFK